VPNFHIEAHQPASCTLELLPTVMSGTVSLPDAPKLINQLVGLERQTTVAAGTLWITGRAA
jgi:hypothetical protein